MQSCDTYIPTESPSCDEYCLEKFCSMTGCWDLGCIYRPVTKKSSSWQKSQVLGWKGFWKVRLVAAGFSGSVCSCNIASTGLLH